MSQIRRMAVAGTVLASLAGCGSDPVYHERVVVVPPPVAPVAAVTPTPAPAPPPQVIIVPATPGPGQIAVVPGPTVVVPSMAQMGVVLTANQEIPPTFSSGTGQGTVTFDRVTRQLSYSISYGNLSGPVTTAHIHGPTPAGAALPIPTAPSNTVNLPPVIILPVTQSPMMGTAMLTDAQAADLLAGRMYINLHTARFPDGEIRGQIAGAPAGTTPAPIILAPRSLQ